MTDDELHELLDLYVADQLPDALQARVEAHLAAHPDAARDADTLRRTLDRLRSAPAERPDTWFVERALGGLLREHASAESVPLIQEN